VLGKQLFFDTRFSGSLSPPNDGVSNGSLGVPGTTGRVACDSCHQPELGGTDHRSRPLATSLGASYTGRNAPTVINAAYSDVAIGGWQFWDGRKDSLWSHALGPPDNGTSIAFRLTPFPGSRCRSRSAWSMIRDRRSLLQLRSRHRRSPGGR
jgi:cytochrome c peroxidase